MKLKAITNYTTAAGKVRRIRLFGSYRNMLGRISGRLHAGNGQRPWKGLECGFTDWAHFRDWALANGYSKSFNSLDRINPEIGYLPTNCRWLSVSANTAYQNACRKYT